MFRRACALLLALLAAFGAVTAATASSGRHRGHRGARGSAAAAGAPATPIKHLVVIFQENVSFDHYFGTYPNAANTSGVPFRARHGHA